MSRILVDTFLRSSAVNPLKLKQIIIYILYIMNIWQKRKSNIVLYLYSILLTSLIYPDLASIIYVAYVQSDALFPCLYLSLWSMPLFVPGLIIVTPSSLAYQNPAWLHCNLSLMRLLV